METEFRRNPASLRLALIHRTFARTGGTERYGWDLAHALSERGVQVHLISSTIVDIRPGWKLHKIPIIFSGLPKLWHFAWQTQRLLRTLRQHAAVSLALSLDRIPSPGMVRLGGGCHRAHLEAVEGWQGQKPPPRQWLNLRHPYYLWLERQWLEGPETQAVIAVSQQVKTELLRHYQPPDERVVVMHNGVQLHRFDPQRHLAHRRRLRQALGLELNALGLLLVGSGARRKGTGTALEGVAQYLQHLRETLAPGPLPFFLVVGKDAPEVVASWSTHAPAWLRAQVRALPPQDPIEACYAACDLLILPTRYEPFGNVCLEAMSMGLPALTSACNGVTELYSPTLAPLRLADPSDAGALAQQLLRVTSPALLPLLAAESRRVALQNGVEAHADRMLALLVRLAARNLAARNTEQNPLQRI